MMSTKFKIFILSVFCSTTISAQKSDILLTINDKNIYKNEFVRAFNKYYNPKWINNKDSVNNYLNQFIEFKLKVEEAKNLRLDKTNAILQEIDAYRKQLLKELIADKQTVDFYINQTYERGKTEIRIRHILIRIDPYASSKDSLFAYQKALNIRKKLMNGAGFKNLAIQISDDPGASKNGGDLWYVKPCSIPYAIENYIYGTSHEKYSLPIRTNLGYHIIEIVDRRPSPGRIKVSHIMLSLPQSSDEKTEESVSQRADSIYSLAINGSDFAQLAFKYSNDQGTSSTGGELPWFETGAMPHEFEEACFQLKNDGDISKPVKTNYGWHIIKRISQKDNPPFEQIKEQLNNIVLNSEKGKLAETVKINKLKKTFDFKDYRALSVFTGIIDSSIFSAEWRIPEGVGLTGVLFSINNQAYSQQEFAEFLEKNQKKMYPIPILNYIETRYNEFINKSIIDKEASEIENNNSDYKLLMKEFIENIMVNDLMEKEIWKKSLDDQEGLTAYYSKNKDRYNKSFFADVCLYSYSTNKVRKIEKQLKKLKGLNLPDIEIEKEIQQTTDEGFMFIKCIKKEEGKDKLLDECIALQKNGTIKKDQRILIFEDRKNLVWLNQEIKKTNKTFEEVKGSLVNDYQINLEKSWISELKKKYPVTVNNEVLEFLVNQ